MSRTFATATTDVGDAHAAITAFATRAAAKLRREGEATTRVTTFAMTDKHGPLAYRRLEATTTLASATFDTPVIVRAALRALGELHQQGTPYRRAGVILSGLSPAEAVQGDAFEPYDVDRSRRLMTAIDAINARLGPDAIHCGPIETKKAKWRSRCDDKSPPYTTSWDHLPRAFRIGDEREGRATATRAKPNSMASRY